MSGIIAICSRFSPRSPSFFFFVRSMIGLISYGPETKMKWVKGESELYKSLLAFGIWALG